MGATVTDIVPLNVLAGNVTVAFAVMSYAGSVTITVTVDPDAVPSPDLDVLVEAPQIELHELEDLGSTNWSLAGHDSHR